MASDSNKPIDFSATDSALAYLHQVRLGPLVVAPTVLKGPASGGAG